MKRRPNLVLRDSVKLYDTESETNATPKLNKKKAIEKSEVSENSAKPKEKIISEIKEQPTYRNPQSQITQSVKEKMSPRIQQIWEYFCRKAKVDGELRKSFHLTRSEVMKEAGIGSTNTYRDALKKFQELDLIEIELRPGVNLGSIFTLTGKGIEQLNISE